MSTSLSQLTGTGAVLKIEPELGPRRMPMRELYATQGFVAWIEALPTTMSIRRREVSPQAEMNEIAAMFVAGKRVVTIMTQILPARRGVVRLKTTSFGLLGWADGPQRLVLSRGVSVDNSHGSNALTVLGKEAAEERKSLGLGFDGRPFYELFCFQG